MRINTMNNWAHWVWSRPNIEKATGVVETEYFDTNRLTATDNVDTELDNYPLHERAWASLFMMMKNLYLTKGFTYLMMDSAPIEKFLL